MLFFAYCYISNVLVITVNLTKDYLIDLWNTVLNFYKIFEYSKNPNTLLWLIEFEAMISKKYSPKEILNNS